CAYGTRSSTVLLASVQDNREGARRWDVRIEERTHWRPEPEATVAQSPGHGATAPQVNSYLIHWQQVPAF
ncbi:MAG: NRDE family protein, partial [Polaromonas sp.]